jgi:hypothetical protein
MDADPMAARHFAPDDSASLREGGEELTAIRQRSVVEPLLWRE